MEPTAQEREQALAGWRDANWHELDACLSVAKAIRDNPEAQPRDRNEANKTIVRMLGAMSARPSDSARNKPTKTVGHTTNEVVDDDVAEIMKLVSDPR